MAIFLNPKTLQVITRPEAAAENLREFGFRLVKFEDDQPAPAPVTEHQEKPARKGRNAKE